jgi:hypothetical protein
LPLPNSFFASIRRTAGPVIGFSRMPSAIPTNRTSVLHARPGSGVSFFASLTRPAALRSSSITLRISSWMSLSPASREAASDIRRREASSS